MRNNRRQKDIEFENFGEPADQRQRRTDLVARVHIFLREVSACTVADHRELSIAVRPVHIDDAALQCNRAAVLLLVQLVDVRNVVV